MVLPHCLLEGEGGLGTRRTVKTNPPTAKAAVYTYLSLLPADVALHFRVLDDSTAGSSAAPSWASDAVRLTDGLAQEATTFSQGFNSSTEQKARQK